MSDDDRSKRAMKESRIEAKEEKPREETPVEKEKQTVVLSIVLVEGSEELRLIWRDP